MQWSVLRFIMSASTRIIGRLQSIPCHLLEGTLRCRQGNDILLGTVSLFWESVPGLFCYTLSFLWWCNAKNKWKYSILMIRILDLNRSAFLKMWIALFLGFHFQHSLWLQAMSRGRQVCHNIQSEKNHPKMFISESDQFSSSFSPLLPFPLWLSSR